MYFLLLSVVQFGEDDGSTLSATMIFAFPSLPFPFPLPVISLGRRFARFASRFDSSSTPTIFNSNFHNNDNNHRGFCSQDQETQTTTTTALETKDTHFSGESPFYTYIILLRVNEFCNPTGQILLFTKVALISVMDIEIK